MKNNTKKTLQYFWKASMKYRISGTLNLVAVVLAVGIGVIVPLYYKDFFNVLANGNLTKNEAVSALIKILIFIAGLGFFGMVFLAGF